MLLLVCLCLYLCFCLACKPVLTYAFRIWGWVNVTPNGNGRRNKGSLIYVGSSKDLTLGTRDFFSLLRPDALVSAMTETGNCAWKVSGSQGGKTHHLANNPEGDSALIFHRSLRQSSILLVFESTQKGQKWKKGFEVTPGNRTWDIRLLAYMLQKPGYVPLVCALYSLFLAYLFFTPSTVLRTLSMVPLVSVLMAFDCNRHMHDWYYNGNDYF